MLLWYPICFFFFSWRRRVCCSNERRLSRQGEVSLCVSVFAFLCRGDASLLTPCSMISLYSLERTVTLTAGRGFRCAYCLVCVFVPRGCLSPFEPLLRLRVLERTTALTAGRGRGRPGGVRQQLHHPGDGVHGQGFQTSQVRVHASTGAVGVGL